MAFEQRAAQHKHLTGTEPVQVQFLWKRSPTGTSPLRLSLQPARKLLLHEQRHSAQPKELFGKKHPGVQSRHLVDRVQDETIRL